MAAHFSWAGRGCFWQRIFGVDWLVLHTSSLYSFGGGLIVVHGCYVFGLRGERGFAGFQRKRKLPKIWLALVLSFVLIWFLINHSAFIICIIGGGW